MTRKRNSMTDSTRRSVLKAGLIATSGYGAVVGISSADEGADLYVNQEGGGPYSSIQAAVEDVSPGTAIRVGSGTYGESVRIPKAVTLVGDPGDDGPGTGEDAPTLDGEGVEGPAFVLDNSDGVSDVTIRGFEVRNYGHTSGDDYGVGVTATRHGSSNVTISDNHFHGLTKAGVHPLPRGINEDWTVTNNIVEDVLGQRAHYCIGMVNTPGATVRNNLVEAIPQDVDADVEDIGISVTAIPDYDARRNVAETVIKDVTVEGNRIVGPFDGPGVEVTAKAEPYAIGSATLDGVTVTDNEISGVRSGVRAWMRAGYQYTEDQTTGTVRIDNLTITGNRISDYANEGVVVEPADRGEEYGVVTVENNEIH